MELLIVTGMSGAGKSLALKSLEDMGFFCVDNLPSPMLKEFISMCKNANPPIRHAAVTMDSREGLLSRSPETVLKEIKKIDVPYTILFLDARDDVLKRRYNETRKRHPLGVSGEAESGVRTERGYLSVIRDAADFVLDTTRHYWERARAAGLLDFEGWSQDFSAFWRAVQWMALQRHLKVAGIFARLTLRDGKPKYLADAPRFITYIRSTAARLPELAPLLHLVDKLGV